MTTKERLQFLLMLLLAPVMGFLAAFVLIATKLA